MTREIIMPIEASHIMMFARSIGDTNPIYYDEAYAEKEDTEGIIAPPTFARAVSQFDPDYELRPKANEPSERSPWVHLQEVKTESCTW